MMTRLNKMLDWLGNNNRVSVSPAVSPAMRAEKCSLLMAGFQPDKVWSLRTVLMGYFVLLLLLTIGITSWVSYRSAMDAAEQIEQQQAAEISKQIRERVTSFFEIPRRVATFNAAQFSSGLLNPKDHDRFVQSFLLQLEQQPLLTFLSMGTAEGEYFSASRPPLGEDKQLRVLKATIADKRVMHVYRVDALNKISSRQSVGNNHFDARTRPWFKAAADSDRIQWVPAYRYAVQDELGVYDALGMGMSAPLYDANKQFIGVVTADVALSQLSHFLKYQSSDLGGVAFVAEQSGELLATSEDEPVYLLNVDKKSRVTIKASVNDTLRAAGIVLQRDGGFSGEQMITVNNERHFFDWKSIQLPNGPSLIIGVVLPESKFIGPINTAVNNMVYQVVAFLVLSIGFILLFTHWVSRPLESLSRWSSQHAKGDRCAKPPLSSPVREVVMLSESLGEMVESLEQRDTEQARKHKSTKRQEVTHAEAKLEFLAMMSRELRTPLNTIIVYARMLAKTSSGLSLPEGLSTIENNSVSLLSLIDQMLDESRLHAEQLELTPTTLQLASWFEDIRHSMTFDALAKGNRFSLIYSGNIPSAVVLDGMRLRQVLDNLFSNANRHTDKGEIRLVCHASMTQAGYAEVASLTFTLFDSGEGIEPADLKRNFAPFVRGQRLEQQGDQRAAGSGTSTGLGLGLGLSISSELLRLMGSELSVASERAVGSTFQFVLNCPVASRGYLLNRGLFASLDAGYASHDPEDLALFNSVKSPSVLASYMVVLLVEDDPEQRQMLAIFLEDAGHLVYTASSGEEAAALLHTLSVEAVVTDQMMSAGDGWFVLRKVRESGKALPVVLQSAAPPLRPLGFPGEMAFDAVLFKPYSIEDLLVTLWILVLKIGSGGPSLTAQQWHALAMLAAQEDVSGIKNWIAALNCADGVGEKEGEQLNTQRLALLTFAALNRKDFKLLESLALRLGY